MSCAERRGLTEARGARLPGRRASYHRALARGRPRARAAPAPALPGSGFPVPASAGPAVAAGRPSGGRPLRADQSGAAPRRDGALRRFSPAPPLASARPRPNLPPIPLPESARARPIGVRGWRRPGRLHGGGDSVFREPRFGRPGGAPPPPGRQRAALRSRLSRPRRDGLRGARGRAAPPGVGAMVSPGSARAGARGAGRRPIKAVGGGARAVRRRRAEKAASPPPDPRTRGPPPPPAASPWPAGREAPPGAGAAATATPGEAGPRAGGSRAGRAGGGPGLLRPDAASRRQPAAPREMEPGTQAHGRREAPEAGGRRGPREAGGRPQTRQVGPRAAGGRAGPRVSAGGASAPDSPGRRGSPPPGSRGPAVGGPVRCLGGGWHRKPGSGAEPCTSPGRHRGDPVSDLGDAAGRGAFKGVDAQRLRGPAGSCARCLARELPRPWPWPWRTERQRRNVRGRPGVAASRGRAAGGGGSSRSAPAARRPRAFAPRFTQRLAGGQPAVWGRTGLASCRAPPACGRGARSRAGGGLCRGTFWGDRGAVGGGPGSSAGLRRGRPAGAAAELRRSGGEDGAAEGPSRVLPETFQNFLGAGVGAESSSTELPGLKPRLVGPFAKVKRGGRSRAALGKEVLRF